jgi:hypothetical protein
VTAFIREGRKERRKEGRNDEKKEGMKVGRLEARPGKGGRKVSWLMFPISFPLRLSPSQGHDVQH